MRLSFAFLLATAACGGGGDSPDAGPGTPDAPSADAAPACAADELCLSLTPIDGVTDLPAGRLVAAWWSIEGDTDRAQIALDEPWIAAPVTRVALPTLASPDAALRVPIDCGVTTVDTAIGIVALVDDPDDSGDISVAEILVAGDTGTIYGIAQAIVLDSPLGCTTPLPEFPSGILAGRHAYAGNEDTVFTLTDGVPVPFTTCAPMTPACRDLEGPL